jgi:tetratricopeptide (TPR) repeat protein
MKRTSFVFPLHFLTYGLCLGAVTSIGSAQESPKKESQNDQAFNVPETGDDLTQMVLNDALEAIALGNIDRAREKLEPLATQKDTLHKEVVLAQLLFARKLNGDAKNVLEKFAIREPKRMDVYLLFSEVAVNEQRWFDSWNLINLAERLAPPESWSAKFRRRIGNRLDILKARCLEGRELCDKAMEIYTKLNATEDDGPEIWIGQARCAYRLKNFDQAIAFFARVKEKNPSIAVPELMLAKQFEADQDAKQAEKYFSFAVSKSGSSVLDRKKSALEFARFLVFNNRTSEALEQIKSPFETNPFATPGNESEGKDPNNEIGDALERERQFLTGVIFRVQQKFTDAQAIFSKLHQQDSLSFPIGNHLALCLVESDQEALRARALQIAEVNVRNNSNLQDAWGTLGYIQFRLGDLVSAETSIRKAVQSGQLNRDTAVILGMIKKSLGDENMAKQLKDQSAKLPGPIFYPDK